MKRQKYFVCCAAIVWIHSETDFLLQTKQAKNSGKPSNLTGTIIDNKETTPNPETKILSVLLAQIPEKYILNNFCYASIRSNPKLFLSYTCSLKKFKKLWGTIRNFWGKIFSKDILMLIGFTISFGDGVPFFISFDMLTN